jgi:26S proteasome regulatory subunit N12
MEGSYSKVWNAREEAPAEEYKFFVDSLMGTIRYVTGLGGLKTSKLLSI